MEEAKIESNDQNEIKISVISKTIKTSNKNHAKVINKYKLIQLN